MAVDVDWATTGSIVAIGATIIGFIWTYFGVILNFRKEYDETIAKTKEDLRKEADDSNRKLLEMIASQSDRITKQETKMELFWNAVGGVMSSLIKQPIHFRKDELMDRLVPDKLPRLAENSVEELLELKAILNDELITLSKIKDPKSLAYALALAYIDQILLDKGVIKA